MRYKADVLIAALLATGGWSGASAAENRTSAADLPRFAAMLDGAFDNFAEAERAQKAGTELLRTHYIYRTARIPAFEGAAHYVQQHYGDGSDPDSIYRQRLYVTMFDPKRQELVTRIYSFSEADAQKMRNAHLDPARLSGMTPKAMTTLAAGCEVFWRADGIDFAGYQRKGDCVLKQPGGGTLLLSDTLRLTASAFSTLTRAENEAGELAFGETVPSDRRRVSPYRCGLPGKAQWRTHDQGGARDIGGTALRLVATDDRRLRMDVLKGEEVTATVAGTARPGGGFAFATTLGAVTCTRD